MSRATDVPNDIASYFDRMYGHAFNSPVSLFLALPVQSHVHIFKERASARFPAFLHGYLTPVLYDAQRAVFYAQHPHIPAHDLTVDQLILRQIAQDLERRKFRAVNSTNKGE